MKALFLIAEGFEDLQFFIPWYRLQEENVRVTVATPYGHSVTGMKGYRVEPDSSIHEVTPTEYDMLIIPGGASPEKLRLREEAVDVARTCMQDEKTVVAIGHGAQLLISSQALDRRTVTCSMGIRDDVRAADANYRDEGVVVDGHLVTCRGNDDLPQLSAMLVHMLSIKSR